MPIPKPKFRESHQNFIQRCLADDIMNKEYPNVDQRLAVCAIQWRNENK